MNVEFWKSHFDGSCHVDSTKKPQLVRDLEQVDNALSEEVILLHMGKTISESPSNRLVSGRLPSSTSSLKRRSDRQSNGQDLDLTGSPLQCSFNLDEDTLDFQNEEFEPITRRSASSLNPLSEKDARILINKFSRLASRDSSTPSSCWALCDGQNEGSIYFGTERNESGVTVHQVKFSGPHFTSDEQMKFQNIQKRHLAAAPNNAKTSTTARVTFQMFGSDSEAEDLSSIAVRLEWTRVQSILEAPPLDATATLDAIIIPGDDKLSTHELWSELNLIRGFSAGLDNEGIAWKQRSEADPTLEEELRLLFEKVKQCGPKAAAKPDESKESENEDVETLAMSARSDVDFTDLLWSTLCKVESYGELNQALSRILNTIQSEGIRPFVNVSNETRVAKIVRNVIKGRPEAIPPMTSGMPLEILVEVGIEKLKRDYIHAFMSSNLTNKDELLWFITNLGHGDRRLSMEILLKFHYILELIVLSQTFLSPNQEFLRQLVQWTLRHFRDASPDPQSHRMSLPIPVAYIREKLIKAKPNVWQCCFKTSGTTMSVRSACRLSIEPPMDFIPNSLKAFDEEDEDINNVPYFQTFMTSISRRI